MRVGIYNDKDHFGRFSKVSRRYEEVLKHNGIDHLRIEVNHENFFDIIRTLDLFIFRWGHYDSDRQQAHTILPIVENHLKVKCFPDLATGWHYDDKVKQYYLLKEYNFPTINSWIFWDKEHALNWIESAKFPVVFKLKGGAGSCNVVLIENQKTAKKIVQKIFGNGIKPLKIPKYAGVKYAKMPLKLKFQEIAIKYIKKLKGEDTSPFWQLDKNYALFQEFIPNNTYDTRVTVIGERAFGFTRVNRANDFRASGSGMLDYDLKKVDLRCIELAHTISKKLGFQSMAYDFLLDENNNIQIAEISYTYPDSVIFKCEGYWDPELNWHQGHYWPQFLQLKDLLNIDDLKQPEVDFNNFN